MADQSRLEIVIDSRTAEGNVRRVGDELERIESAGTSAQRAASSAAGGFGNIAKQAQLAVPPVSQMTQLLGGLAGIIGTQQIIAYSDAWKGASNELRQVTSNTAELAGVQETLLGVANQTRSDFSSTATLYSRLSRATESLGLSQSDVVGLTRTINQSFALSGATAGEAAGAITQLAQGLASGALRGDEFNSVSEQAPGIMRAIAAETGKSIGELRDFAAEGGITADLVVRSLRSASRSIEQDFGQSVATFGQQMTVARNNLIQFVGQADSVEDALSNVGEAAITLSENLDAVAKAGIVLGGVVGGRMVGRIITLGAGMATAAGAATALRTALAFLGGPAGVAVAAATGLIAFREELGLVPTPAEDARRQVELLTGSIEDMNAAAIDTAMIGINAQLFELERKAREAREELRQLQNDSSSGALGLAAGTTGRRAMLQGQLGDIGAQRGALVAEQERLQALSEGLDDAGEAGDRAGESLDRLGQTADDVVAKFKPMLNQDVENILARAGEGSTIDDQGRLRDAWGNFLPTLQRELETEIRNQQNTFTSQQNLQAGLNALLGSNETTPTLMPTKQQDAVPALAGKPMGTFTIRVSKDGEGDTEGTVQGNEDFIRKMADALGGVASAV